MRIPDAVLAELKHRNPCDKVAAQWVRLRRHGKKQIGPCPICSDDRQSKSATRFEVDASGFVCAVCETGGDVIRLLEKVEGLDFRAAVERLGGTRDIDPEAAALAEAEREKKRADREREAAAYRERERKRLFEMWLRAILIHGTPAEAYLRLRGVEPVAGAHLRYLADAPLFASGRENDPVIVHRGPCLLGAILSPSRRFAGLHFTWIDLAQPKGKALVPDPETGELVPAKKVRGTKQGGRIELKFCEEPDRLVIGEGIEKVLAVHLALHRAGHALERTAFWSSIDLGNLGGRATGSVAHPTLRTEHGRPRRVPGPAPDLDAVSIPVPLSVSEIVLLGDSTSDRFLTECALKRAAARWARPGRIIRTAWAPEDADFDDLLRNTASSSSAAAKSLEAA